MKISRSKVQAGFTLVEIMIVVLIIGILLAIAIPNFVSARETSRAKACVANLKQIDDAKQQAAMDDKLSGTSTDTFMIDGTTASTGTAIQLVGPTAYIRSTPVCPEGGTYTGNLGTVATIPYCSISGISATANGGTAVAGSETGTDYLPGGKFYHGLE